MGTRLPVPSNMWSVLLQLGSRTTPSKSDPSHSPRHATDAESGEDSTDGKERDGGRGGLHRHAGAEDEQIGANTESATEPSTDVATRDRTAEAVAIDSLVSTRAKIPDRHERLGRLTCPPRGSR